MILRLLLITLFTWQVQANGDFLSSCSTKERSSYFHLSCHLEKDNKRHELNFYFSKFKMVNPNQAKGFCERNFSKLDNAFLYLSMEQMVYLNEELMDHLIGVNALNQGRTLINWSASGGISIAEFDHHGEVKEASGAGEQLYAICSDVPVGIFLDLRI